MKIEVELRDKFGREAVISFSDAAIDTECSHDMQKTLEADLKDLMTVFGGLTGKLASWGGSKRRRRRRTHYC